MVIRALGRIWKWLPPFARIFITRRSQNTFTVSVAGIITNDEQKVLLLDHVFRPQSGWGIPGGFIDYGEQPVAAFEREVSEETGLQLSDVKLYRVRTRKRHIEIVFTANTEGHAELKSTEIQGLGWFTVDDLPEAMNPKQKALISEVLSHEI